jgi:Uma2 family endonuclease
MTALQGVDKVILEFDPQDGPITRDAFERLPKPPKRWAWELRAGKLDLIHMPISAWHWTIVLMILEYWTRAGYTTVGEQYVSDSGFARGGTGKHNFVADGLVFVPGYKLHPRDTGHDATDIHLVIEAVSEGSEERDTFEKFGIYAELGIPNYWVVRHTAESDPDDFDGTITMYELRNGRYEAAGNKLVSQLAAPA